MKYFFNNVFYILLITISFQTISAQENQTVSLLSNIGLGTVFSESTVEQKAQGDVNVVGNDNVEYASIANPALLANLRLTSLRFEGKGSGANIETSNQEYTSSVFSVSNISFAFPLGKYGGFGTGLRVNSATGFEVDAPTNYNKGSGSVNEVYFGTGFKVIKGLSLGAQFSYLFGKNEKLQAFKTASKVSINEDVYNVKGSSFRVGARYLHHINKKVKAQFGTYFVFENEIEANGTNEFYEAVETGVDNNFLRFATTQIIDGLQVSVPVTLSSNSITGTQVNPLKTVLGLGIGEDQKWFVNASYQFQDAVAYSGNTFNSTINLGNVGFEKSNQLSIGGYIVPEKYAYKKYLKRIIYRAGFKYANTGIVLENESLKNIGMSFGLGLPVGRKVTYINLTGEVGRLGDKSKNNYQETYMNLGLSFTLSDFWFKKSVID